MILAIEERVQKSILNKLQGYITTSQRDSAENITEMEYDNAISEEEIEDFYYQSLSQCLSYCYLVNFPTETIENNVVIMNRQFENAVILFAAGLIWRKYDIRANDNVEEVGSYVISYGDQLIIDAKKQLEPFIFKSVAFW